MKSLWVKNVGKIGVDGMLAFVPPFSGITVGKWECIPIPQERAFPPQF